MSSARSTILLRWERKRGVRSHVGALCPGAVDWLPRTETHTAGQTLVKTKRAMFLSASGGSDLNELVNKRAVSRPMKVVAAKKRTANP
jgi:hypothetical protein